MAEPFIGEIRTFGFNFPPKYWAYASGQLLGISQNLALFSLLGTQFGGNGSTNFALPNLLERVPVASGKSYVQGQPGGATSHTLTQPELAQHTHNVVADTAQGTPSPTATSRLAASTGVAFYRDPGPNLQPLNDSAISRTGASPHENMAPTLVINFCICLSGIFPSRN
jgi:microcystin-dependent protein